MVSTVIDGVMTNPTTSTDADRALVEHREVLRAQAGSVSAVLALTESLEAREVGACLTDHFEADGLVLLRKTLIARLEPLMMATDRASRGLVPRIVGIVFHRWTRNSQAPAGIGERWLLNGLWLMLLLRVALLPFVRGCRRSAIAKRFMMGVPNKWGPPRPGSAHHDLLLVNPPITRADVVVLAQGRRFVTDYAALGIEVIDVARVKPVRAAWFGDIAPRLQRLAAAQLRRSVSTTAGWLASFGAWEAAWRSIDWECTFATVSVDVVADVEEQNALHAVKTCVVGRRGGRTLRVPHTQPDTPGTHTAFWMYHAVAVSSEYLPREYGGTWWREGRVEPVGLMFNSTDDRPVPWLDEIRRRGPILTLFTGSDVGLQARVHDALAAIAVEMLRRHPRLQLVVKPKPSHVQFVSRGSSGETLRSLVDEGRAIVLNPATTQWCTAAQLMRASTVSLTYGGSVVTEALALLAPIVVFPAVPGHATGWTDVLRDRVLFETPEHALDKLDALLAGDRGHQLDDSTLSTYCDPFRDGSALARLTDLSLRIRKAA